MARDEEVQFEQDRLGNERKKLDTLRAQEGMVQNDEDGIVQIGSVKAGTDVIAYSLPGHADEVMVDTLEAYNSKSSGNNIVSLYELTLDSSGNITDTTRRSVPIHVSVDETRKFEYDGEPVDADAIGVNAEFEGFVGVSVIVDHKESSENPSL